MSLDLDKSTWTRFSLGDVADASRDRVDPSKGEVERYIAGEHMDSDDLTIHRWGAVGDGYLGPAFHRRFRPGQVLYGSRRTYLRKVAVAEFEGVTANTTFVVETKDPAQLSQRFLPFIMSSEPFHAFAIKESKGSVNPYVNWSDIARYEFDLPPLDEQERLADLLWAVERATHSSHRVKTKIDDARTSWLDMRIAELLADDSLPFERVWTRSPESGWSATPVDECTRKYVLSLAALGPRGYRRGNLKNVLDSVQTTGATVRTGDLLISRANTAETVGRVGIFDEVREDVAFPDTIMRLVLNESVLPEFAAAILASSHGRRHMRRTAAGSATSMVKINRKSLGQFVFPHASLPIQQQLLSSLGEFDKAIDQVGRDDNMLNRIKFALVHGILGGTA